MLDFATCTLSCPLFSPTFRISVNSMFQVGIYRRFRPVKLSKFFSASIVNSNIFLLSKSFESLFCTNCSSWHTFFPRCLQVQLSDAYIKQQPPYFLRRTMQEPAFQRWTLHHVKHTQPVTRLRKHHIKYSCTARHICPQGRIMPVDAFIARAATLSTSFAGVWCNGGRAVVGCDLDRAYTALQQHAHSASAVEHNERVG